MPPVPPVAPTFHPVDILGIVLFATSVFLPFFITGFAPMSERTWMLFVVARILWHVGGLFGLGVAIFGMMQRSRLLGGVLLVPLALVFCINPVLDLLRGPLRVQGVVEDEQVFRLSGEGGMNAGIWMTIQIRQSDGSLVTFKPSGLRANKWETFRTECARNGARVRLVALRHLKVPLEMTCLG